MSKAVYDTVREPLFLKEEATGVGNVAPTTKKKYLFFLAYNIFAVFLNRQLIGAFDPVAQLLSTVPREGATYASDTMTVSRVFSFTMMAFPIVSALGNSLGPRKMAVCTCLISCSGMVLIFFIRTSLSVKFGLFLAGFGFSGCISGMYPVFAIYPNHVGLIMGLLGGASDLSLLVPTGMAMLIGTMDPLYTASFVILLLLTSAYVLWSIIPPRGWLSLIPNRRDSNVSVNSVREVSLSPFKGNTTREALMSLEFIVFMIWFVPNTLRVKKHFMPYYRLIFEEVHGLDSEYMCNVIAVCSSLGFLTSIAVGKTADSYGVFAILAGTTAFAIIFSSCLSFGNAWVQYYMCPLLFIQQTGASFGLSSMFLSKVFPAKMFASLQGSVYLIFGVICIAFDYIWTPYNIQHYFESYRYANTVLSVTLIGIQLVALVCLKKYGHIKVA